MNPTFDLHEYLRPFLRRIVILKATMTLQGTMFSPPWTKRRDKYLYVGTIGDENLREILPDEVVIEFDSAEDTPEARVQAKGYIDKLKTVFDQMGRRYHITDHAGKSPHFRFRVEGLAEYQFELRKQYKLDFVKQLMTEIGYVAGNVTYDESLLNTERKLLSIEGKPHFKAKYGGALEQVIDYSDAPYITVKHAIMKQYTDSMWDSVKGQTSPLAEKIKAAVKMSDVLRKYGIDTTKNITMCPMGHASQGGKCLSFDDAKGLCHCFHAGCTLEGDVITVIEKREGLSFIDACRYLKDHFSVDVDLEAHTVRKNTESNKYRIVLNKQNQSADNLAEQIVYAYAQDPKKWKMYYHIPTGKLVEIIEKPNSRDDSILTRIENVEKTRFVNLLQEHIEFVRVRENKDGDFEEYATNLTENQAKLLMTNTLFLSSVPPIYSILNYCAPYVIRGNLIVTQQGYNPQHGLCIYVTRGAPAINRLPTEIAIEHLRAILKDFCWETSDDLVMGWAYLLTQYARGFYERPTARTPLFIVQANRERAGKDYLAACIGTLYEGQYTEHTPISSRDGVRDEEFRKKMTALILSGTRRFHSANNRGRMDSPFFEQLLTSEVYEDRLLGSNSTAKLPVEIEFSLSANTGFEYTADIANRSRVISLFYAEEDANARTFPIADLKGHIAKNRATLLSAIYSLYADWYDAGQFRAEGSFTSFPEWHRVVAGVMAHHNLGNPSKLQKLAQIGGDSETDDMKKLYEYFYRLGWADYTTAQMIQMLRDDAEREFMSYWTFTESKDKIVFGRLIRRFDRRILGNIKMSCVTGLDVRSDKRRYKFEATMPRDVPNMAFIEKIKAFKLNHADKCKVEQNVLHIDTESLGAVYGAQTVDHWLVTGELMRMKLGHVSLEWQE